MELRTFPSGIGGFIGVDGGKNSFSIICRREIPPGIANLSYLLAYSLWLKWAIATPYLNE